ncbi:MAG: hypothetical protein IPL26_01190 [Leptospiraceae bacterium]|nr:hypothetical protein [Leptospiraceae bacterium]
MENKKTKEEHISDWELSGLSKAEYCRRTGLRYKTFQKWKRKENPKKVDWKPIQIHEELEESKSIFEIRLSDNWKLEINVRFRT